MPIGGASSSKQLPFINQSLARRMRSSVFRTKTPVGPETAQAMTEGKLSVAADEAIQQENIQQQAKAEKERLVERERSSRESERFNREQLAEQSKQADLRRQDQRRARKDAEPTFFEGLLGS